MSKIKTIKSLWDTDKRGIIVAMYNHIVHIGFTNIMSDENFLRLTYMLHFGKKLDLANPKSFNEKLQWLKLYDRKDIYTTMVDKYEVKEYVKGIVGDKCIVPTISVWESVKDIDISELPNKFVLKCTHDSGSVVVCKDKKTFNFKKAKKKLKNSMCKNLYYWGREWPYKNVIPRVIAETYLEDENHSDELIDYKLMCFNGEVKCSFTVTNRFPGDDMRVTFYDKNWERMPFTRHYKAADIDIPKPSSYEEMVNIAEKLANGLTFARIDFYEIGGHPYFGEITLCPGNGVERFTPTEWDNILGGWIELPKQSK